MPLEAPVTSATFPFRFPIGPPSGSIARSTFQLDRSAIRTVRCPWYSNLPERSASYLEPSVEAGPRQAAELGTAPAIDPEIGWER
jgi:hypothetical protein